ncbi:MAG: hypothetical protein SFT93_02955 [Rickettsiaceae bacterium]|nr:hypothetical protein [Rickettsiaceae bacterium]
MSSIIEAGLKFADKKTDLLTENALAELDPTISVKTLSAKTILSSGRITGLKSDIIRNVDLFKLQMGREYARRVEESGQIINSLSLIQNRISLIEDNKIEPLANELMEFFGSIELAAESPEDQTAKKLCVLKASEVASSINILARECYEQKIQAQDKIIRELDDINRVIRELAEINKLILEANSYGGEITNLEDTRDKLINEIAACIMIDEPSYSRGAVMLSSSGRALLKTDGNFASFEFMPQDSHLIKNGEKLNNIYIKTLRYTGKDSAGEITGSFVSREIFYDSAKDSSIKGGRLKGLLDLYNKELPLYIGALDALAFNVSEHVNRIHNSGSSFPGRSEITGSEVVSASTKSTWAGTARIGIVDKMGRSIKTSSGAAGYTVNPMVINLEQLSNVSNDMMLSVPTILAEINAHFGLTHNKALGMGKQGSEEKYLLHDINLVVSNAQNGQIKFDFEGLNTSDFDANLEILGITIPAGSSVLGRIPSSALIKSKDKTRTFQSITLNKGSLSGNQQLDVKFRVRGENGVIKEGTLRFSLDFDADIPASTRIAGSLPGGGLDGDFAIRNLDRIGLISAKIVDKDGNEVKDASDGYLHLSNISGEEYKIVIQDDTSETGSVWADGFGPIKRGFGHYFGLNNLFELTRGIGNYAHSLKIREDIDQDETLLSMSRFTRSNKIDTIQRIGVSSARASVSFAQFAGPITIGTYDLANLNINGRVYRLVNGPATANLDISIQGLVSSTDIIDKIVASLNADQYFNELIVFERNGDNLDMKIKVAGEDGNNLTYRFFSAGGAIFNSVADTTTLNFAGGQSDDIKLAVYESGMVLTASCQDVFNDLLTLNETTNFFANQYINFPIGGMTNFASAVLKRMLTRFSEIENEHKTSEAILKDFATDYKNNFGFDKNDQVVELTDLVAFRSSISFALTKRAEMFKELINALMRI